MNIFNSFECLVQTIFLSNTKSFKRLDTFVFEISNPIVDTSGQNSAILENRQRLLKRTKIKGFSYSVFQTPIHIYIVVDTWITDVLRH